MSKMQFDELLKGAEVRFKVVQGVQYLSIRDFIMAVCKTDYKNASKKWCTMTEERKEEVSPFVRHLKFAGPGQKLQPVITFPGAVNLLMWLGGDYAKKFRRKVIDILTKYFAGDKSLFGDIEANAASDNPVNQAARAALNNPQPQTSVGDNEEEQALVKRRKLYDDLGSSLSVTTKEVKQYSTSLSTCNRHLAKHIDLKAKFYDMEIKFEHDKLTIERAKLSLLNDGRFQDLEYKRALKAIDAEGPAPPAPTAPSVSIPTAVPDAAAATTTLFKVYDGNKENYPMLRFDQRKSFLQKSGALTAQLYRQTYGSHPPFKQLESGIEVNAYPLEAEPILSEALRTVYRELTAGESQPTIDAVFKKSAVETA